MDLFGVGGRRASRAGKTLYSQLELNKTASQADIKRQYRKLALKYHPDKNSGSLEGAEKFKEINKAYHTLTDPKKKEIYDKYGSFGLQLAERVGEDNVKTYVNLSSWWCQSLVICSAIFTLGCCCCCCCFCCGKCFSKENEDNPDLETDVEGLEREATDETGFSQFSTTTEQPRSTYNNGNNIYVIPMPQTGT